MIEQEEVWIFPSLFFLCFALVANSFGRNGKNNYFFCKFCYEKFGGGEINFVTCNSCRVVNNIV